MFFFSVRTTKVRVPPRPRPKWFVFFAFFPSTVFPLKKNGVFLREDTQKSVFFSGRTTKGVGRVNPPDHKIKSKKKCFFLNSDCFIPKLGGKKRKTCQNPFQAIIRIIKKYKKSGIDH